MEFAGSRKRGRPENENGGFKKSKQEVDSITTGIGSKSKPCTKFFSTSGCPFGEGCHFSHHVPGGMKAVSQMLNLGGNSAPQPASRNTVPPPSFPDVSSPPTVKSRICNKFNSAEGCKFGDKCYFAHGEWELGKPSGPVYEDPRSMIPSRMGGRFEPPHRGFGVAGSFGASATAKISVDASLSGAIIGKNGVNSKQICHVTGAKLSIRDHESNPNLRNIELEGTFDQIKQATGMVRELIGNVQSNMGHSMRNHGMGGPPPSRKAGSNNMKNAGSNNFKTKICDNFTKGCCTFGERCHFAHGEEELRKGT